MKYFTYMTLVALTTATPITTIAQEAKIHQLKKGETLRQLAKIHLGGEEFAVELQNLNRIPNALAAKPGMMIVIPGVARKRAIDELTASHEELDAAIDAAGEIYAKAELDLASQTYRDAQKEISLGSYEKSRLLAVLAAAQARAAKIAADERAVIEEPAKLTAVQGTVTITDANQPPIQAKVKDELKVRQILTTGKNGRCEITLADGSILQVRPDSRLTIEAFRRDRRDDVRNSQLRVIMGDVLGKVKKRKNLKSRFKVNSSHTNVAIRGTELRVGGDTAGTTRVSLLTGDISVEAESKAIEVAPNFGTFVKKNTPPQPPIKLLPAPEMVRPSAATSTSGWVSNPFEWKPIKHRRIAKYRFELATDTDFNAIVSDELTATNKVPPVKLTPGNYFWRIASVDKDGLEGRASSGELTIVRDLRIQFTPESPPLKNGDIWVLGEDNTVKLVPTLQESTVDILEYSVNGQPFVETPSRMFFKNDGDFIVRARGVAENGDKGEVVEQRLEIDKTPPTISVDIKAVGNKKRVTITAKDKNGIGSILYRTQRVFQTYKDPILIDIGTPIDIRATDPVGNTRSHRTFAK